MRPEVAPLMGYAQSAIRRSLEARMPKVPEPKPGEAELTEEEKRVLEQHYQTLK